MGDVKKKCRICREVLPSGHALGGHMSKHKRAKAKRAATIAAKTSQPTLAKVAQAMMPAPGTPEARKLLKHVQARIAGNVTVDMGEPTPRACLDLRAAAKRKRDEALKLETLAKGKRDEANELERLAERIGRIL